MFVAVARSQFPGSLPPCSALNHNIASDMLSSGQLVAVCICRKILPGISFQRRSCSNRQRARPSTVNFTRGTGHLAADGGRRFPNMMQVTSIYRSNRPPNCPALAESVGRPWAYRPPCQKICAGDRRCTGHRAGNVCDGMRHGVPLCLKQVPIN